MSKTFLGNLKGPQGPPGLPFKISKTYNSVAAMNSDISSIEDGAMVLIATGNVEDEDNAKLYAKSEGVMQFIVDLSGAKGIQGPPAPKPIFTLEANGDLYVEYDGE